METRPASWPCLARGPSAPEIWAISGRPLHVDQESVQNLNSEFGMMSVSGCLVTLSAPPPGKCTTIY